MPGKNTGFTLGTDYSVSYGYDDVGRFNSIAWDMAGVSDAAGYTYLENSDLLNQLTTNNGQRTTYNYEPDRDLRTRVKNEFGASLISQYDYQYDELGRRNSVLNSGQAFAAVNNAFNLYDYNDRSEVIESARYLGHNIADTSNPLESEYRTYEYDPIGNRQQITEGTYAGTYASNALNQYTIQNLPVGGTNSFTYDLDGNLTEITEGAATTEYRYNAENRLIAVQPQNPLNRDLKVEFTYDYMGRRVQKIVSGFESGGWVLQSVKRFIYNGWNLILELTSGGARSGDKYYVWGLDLSQTIQGAGGVGGLLTSVEGLAGDFDKDGDVDGSDLAELANDLGLTDLSVFSLNFGGGSSAASSGSYYYFYDGTGNVGQMVGAENGEIVALYEYDPFGNRIFSDGVLAVSNSYGFSTKYFDGENEFYYYGYRYYSPKLGKWMNQDPVGEVDGINLYGFVSNDAINIVDVLGLTELDDCCGKEIGDKLQILLKVIEAKLLSDYELRKSVCRGMIWPMGWDIEELKEDLYEGVKPDEFVDYDNNCGLGRCQDTVAVDGDCHKDDGVNYILWGQLTKICNLQLNQAEVLVEIHRTIFPPIATIMHSIQNRSWTVESRNLDTRLTWTRMGYRGQLEWGGDCLTRENCSLSFFEHHRIYEPYETADWNSSVNELTDCKKCCGDNYSGELTARMRKANGSYYCIRSDGARTQCRKTY